MDPCPPLLLWIRHCTKASKIETVLNSLRARVIHAGADNDISLPAWGIHFYSSGGSIITQMAVVVSVTHLTGVIGVLQRQLFLGGLEVVERSVGLVQFA